METDPLAGFGSLVFALPPASVYSIFRQKQSLPEPWYTPMGSVLTVEWKS